MENLPKEVRNNRTPDNMKNCIAETQSNFMNEGHKWKCGFQQIDWPVQSGVEEE